MELNSDLQQSLYASGEFYSRKELSAWMKRVFRAEFESEQSAIDAAREFRPPSLPSSSPNEPLAKARQTMQIAELRVPGEGTSFAARPRSHGAFRVGKDGVMRPAGGARDRLAQLRTPSRSAQALGQYAAAAAQADGAVDCRGGLVDGGWGPGRGQAHRASARCPARRRHRRRSADAVRPGRRGQLVGRKRPRPGDHPEPLRSADRCPERYRRRPDAGPYDAQRVRHDGESAPSVGMHDPGDTETQAYSPLSSSEADPHDTADTILREGRADHRRPGKPTKPAAPSPASGAPTPATKPAAPAAKPAAPPLLSWLLPRLSDRRWSRPRGGCDAQAAGEHAGPQPSGRRWGRR